MSLVASPKCGGRRKVLAILTDPEVVRKILSHLGLEAALRLSPRRDGARDLRLWEWDEDPGAEPWVLGVRGGEDARR